MDDRRFDEIMTEYVESNKRDKEKILRKFREKEEQREKKSLGFSRFTIAACACALLAVITLSVVLPLSLGKKNRSGDQADDGGRVALDYQVAYANEDEDPSMDYSSSTNEMLNMYRNEKLIIRSYDEYRADKLHHFYYAGEVFFEENALIAVFTYGTEYSHSQLLGVYKENNKVILSVSKQKENVFEQTVETKCFAPLPSFRESSAESSSAYDEHIANVHILRVDKKQIQNVNTVEVEIEYSKQLIAFDDAVADGLITEEDTYSIRYNLQQEFILDPWEPNEDFTLPEDFEPAPKDPAELDDETKAAIRQAYVDSCNQWWIRKLDLDFDRRYKRHKGEIIYLGTYNGYVATTIRAEIFVFRVPSEEVEPIVFLCKVD